MFLGLYIFLLVGLGIVSLLNFLLIQKRILGYASFAILSGIGMTLFIQHLLFAPEPELLLPNTAFYYWNPHYSFFGMSMTLAGLFLASSVYCISTFQVAVHAVSPLVKKRGYLMAAGGLTASFAGYLFFGAHLFEARILPILANLALLPGSLGFFMMVLPLFLEWGDQPHASKAEMRR
ncbi:MAG: hypothetical protein HY460_00870 [Parcubacteria group bacterium]|nr:hypothetical protein [Parcubacteria group bacterium]